MISPVHIHASAPTRIDLAGGTLDIWPLYLFHDGAQTLNAAISLRASCDLRSRTDRRLAIVSEDSKQRVEVEHWSQLRDNHDLRLLGRLLHYFRAEGLELTTRSDSPVGAGIAGSSALNIAVCGALNAWSGGHRTADEIFQIAMNVEAQAIDVPTGAQDYRPAYYGGISAVELGVNGVRRVAHRRAPDELQQRLALAYTNASRNSGINNWDVTKRHIDGDTGVQRSFARIRDIAAAMRDRARAARLAGGRPPDRRRVGEPQAAGPRRDHARRSTRCSTAAQQGRRARRQGLRRRRRRLPVLLRRPRRHPRHPPGPRTTPAHACSTSPSKRAAC